MVSRASGRPPASASRRRRSPGRRAAGRAWRVRRSARGPVRGSNRSANRRFESAAPSNAARPTWGVVSSSVPPGFEHPAQLRQPRRDVRDVLDDLARPHHVDAGVVERQRLVVGPEARHEPGDPPLGAAQRLGRDVDGDRVRTDVAQRLAEPPLAAADVEHGLPGADVLEEERAAQRVALGLQPLGQRAQIASCCSLTRRCSQPAGGAQPGHASVAGHQQDEPHRGHRHQQHEPQQQQVRHRGRLRAGPSARAPMSTAASIVPAWPGAAGTRASIEESARM